MDETTALNQRKASWLRRRTAQAGPNSLTIRDEHIESVPLAQAFTEDYAQLAVSVVMDKARKTVLITSSPSMHELSAGVFEVKGKNLLVRDDPGEYARRVQPRWRKESFTAFLSGEHPPDPEVTYRRLREALTKLIDFAATPTNADVVCCWVIGTYLYRMFDAYPYLGVLRPMGSGKTKLAAALEEVAFNPQRVDSISTAQIFRSIEVSGGTLILDEQESLAGWQANSDTLPILRGGYKKGGKVLRSRESDGGFRTEEFDTYGPKVLITTTGIDDLLASRCVGLHMLRSTDTQGKALVADRAREMRDVRDDLYRLTLEVFPQVREAYRDPEFAPELNARQRERWLPLLSIAKVFCPDRLDALQDAAVGDKDADTVLADPLDVAFLRALDQLVNKPTVDLGTLKIAGEMGRVLGYGMEEVSAAKVGRLVTKYLGKVGRRSGEKGRTVYVITRGHVDDILERYPRSRPIEWCKSTSSC